MRASRPGRGARGRPRHAVEQKRPRPVSAAVSCCLGNTRRHMCDGYLASDLGKANAVCCCHRPATDCRLCWRPTAPGSRTAPPGEIDGLLRALVSFCDQRLPAAKPPPSIPGRSHPLESERDHASQDDHRDAEYDPPEQRLRCSAPPIESQSVHASTSISPPIAGSERSPSARRHCLGHAGRVRCLPQTYLTAEGSRCRTLSGAAVVFPV